jgi:PTS system beta-glucosides-specific IIC component
MSYFEHWLKKFTPQSLQFIIVPALCLIIFVPLTIMVFGPIGGLIASGIETAYSALMGNLVIMDILLGGFFSIIILLGLHWAVTPIMLAILASQGYEYGLAAGGMGNYAALGICLAVAIFAKGAQDKTTASSAAFTNALCGITEPGLYGIILRDKRLIATMVISGACGGLILGLGQVAATNFAYSGILSFGAWLGAKNFPMYCVGIVVSLVVSFGVTTALLKSHQIKEFD